MNPRDIQINMFGIETRFINEMVERSPSTPKELSISILSDVQEMIERDMKEEARQAINRVKYILDTYEYNHKKESKA